MKNPSWTAIYLILILAPIIPIVIYSIALPMSSSTVYLWTGGEITEYFIPALAFGSPLWIGWFAFWTYVLWNKAWQIPEEKP